MCLAKLDGRRISRVQAIGLMLGAPSFEWGGKIGGEGKPVFLREYLL